ncbi:MAG: 2-amino-4-hydroxy-6-hydroxymethyldihydropteridine diphosphokinase [Candidatus Parcubacteria bacterium]|nr:2-amino-4-hydroxy-6-hydroxymethyldihydropteridine diphosphokinase [Burkholderiales bacterium]
MTLAFVGLGANLGDPQRTVSEAILELGRLPGSALSARSSLYRSAPVGYTGQPDFINAVVAIETVLAAEPLLDRLQQIENHHDRQRSFRGAPRTLDLDLLLYGDARLDTPRLTVPHPRLHERAFVLRPLAEIAPQAEIPGHGRVGALLAGCRDQSAERIGPGGA